MAMISRRDTPVVFDFYGTLVLTQEHDRAWTAWHEYLNGYLHRRGVNSDATVPGIPDDFWDKEIDLPGNATVFEYKLREYMSLFSLDLTKREATKLANNLCDVWQEGLRIDPAVYEVLPYFRGRAGLVTNFDHPPHIRKLLKINRLEGYFETVVVSGEEGIQKPDPEILFTACRRMGCCPREAVYVGDAIVDYEAASQAGMKPVIIRRKGQITPIGSRYNRMNPEDIPAYIAEKEDSGELEIVESLLEIPSLVDGR